MEVFKKHRVIFTAFFVCEHVEETNWFKKVLSFFAGALLYAVNTFSLFTSLIFVVKYANVDLESTLYAIFQASAILTVWYMMTEAFFYRSEMAAVFEKYAEFYAKCIKFECSVKRKTI